MPSLTATGWRVKWGSQFCTCNFTYFSLVSAQKSKKLSASFVTHHLIFTQALASAAFREGVCAPLCLESPDRTLEMVSLDGLKDVYLRAA